MTQTPEQRLSLDDKAQLFDYRQAANPIRSGLTEPIPYRCWSPELHRQGPSGVIPLDLSAELGVSGPATSPGLAAHFIRINAGEGVRAAAIATSALFFVLSGEGLCRCRAEDSETTVRWSQGDLFVLPAGGTPLLEGTTDSVLYWVHDAPLLSYLGVTPSKPASRPPTTRRHGFSPSCSNWPDSQEARTAIASACCWPTVICRAPAPSPTSSGRCMGSCPPIQTKPHTATNPWRWT